MPKSFLKKNRRDTIQLIKRFKHFPIDCVTSYKFLIVIFISKILVYQANIHCKLRSD